MVQLERASECGSEYAFAHVVDVVGVDSIWNAACTKNSARRQSTRRIRRIDGVIKPSIDLGNVVEAHKPMQALDGGLDVNDE